MHWNLNALALASAFKGRGIGTTPSFTFEDGANRADENLVVTNPNYIALPIETQATPGSMFVRNNRFEVNSGSLWANVLYNRPMFREHAIEKDISPLTPTERVRLLLSAESQNDMLVMAVSGANGGEISLNLFEGGTQSLGPTTTFDSSIPHRVRAEYSGDGTVRAFVDNILVLERTGIPASFEVDNRYVGWSLRDTAGTRNLYSDNVRITENKAKVSIEIYKRSVLEVAPEHIAFRAVVTGFTGISQNLDRAGYDPASANLIVGWDFGDVGSTSRTDSRLLPHMRDMNKGSGLMAAHAFESAGTKTVTVYAYNPATKEFASNTLDVSIGAATPTVVTVGPAGTHADLASALAVISGQTGHHEIQLQDDQTFTLTGESIGSTIPPLTITRSGTGTSPPILRKTTSGNMLLFSNYDIAQNKDVRIFDVIFEGTWDTTTETGQANTVGVLLGGFEPHYFFAQDCEFRNLSKNIGTASVADNQRASIFENRNYHHDWRDYARFLNKRFFYAATGCRVTQNVNALSGGDKDGTHNNHGCLRSTGAGFAYIAHEDGFNRCGWSGYEGHRAIQPWIRWGTNGPTENRLYIYQCIAEAGNGILNSSPETDYNAAQPPENQQQSIARPGNVVADSLYLLGSYQTAWFVVLRGPSGVFRNCYFIWPNVAAHSGVADPSRIIDFGLIGAGNNDTNAYEPQVATIPQRGEFCTAINLVSSANEVTPSPLGARWGWGQSGVIGYLTNTSYDPTNSILINPNHTGEDAESQGFQPVDQSSLGIPFLYNGYNEGGGAIVFAADSTTETAWVGIPQSGSSVYKNVNNGMYFEDAIQAFRLQNTSGGYRA